MACSAVGNSNLITSRCDPCLGLRAPELELDKREAVGPWEAVHSFWWFHPESRA